MRFLVSIAVVGAVSQVSLAQEHVDVLLLPSGDGTSIVTGSYDDDTMMQVAPSERVFGAEFGEADPMDMNFADEPGFQSFDPSFDGLDWGFDIVDAVRVWDGSDFDTVSPLTMTLEFGFSVTSPVMAGGTTPGFDLPIPVGGFHDHLDIFLDAPDQTAAHDGVYLLSLNARVTGFNSSDTYWFVMNRGLDEEVHDAAIDYVRDVLVPTPGAFATFALAGVVFHGRRRRESEAS